MYQPAYVVAEGKEHQSHKQRKTYQLSLGLRPETIS